MHVAVDGAIFEQQARGGISRLYHEVLPRLCELDEELRITLHLRGGARQELPSHPRIVRRDIPDARALLRPRRVWRRLPFDSAERLQALVASVALAGGRGAIWHSTYYTVPGAWSGPEVVLVHDLIHERFPELFDRPKDRRVVQRKRRSIERADVVVCISEVTASDVTRVYGVAEDRLRVVPLAHSAVFAASPAPGQERDGAFLLYVGGRSPYKNFDALLEAMAAWPRRDVDLIVVGPDWSAEERARIEALGLAGRVRREIDVDDLRLRGLYNGAVALVYPSLYEGFGLPLLEAMACGCPIVASDIPSTREVAGDVPFYFRTGDGDAFVSALSAVAEAGRRSGRRELGLHRAREYSWDRTARRLLDVYRSLVAEPRPRSRGDRGG